MTDLISHIAHPPEVLAWSNEQHARMLAAVRNRDATARGEARSPSISTAPSTSLAGLLPVGALDFRPAAAVDSRARGSGTKPL